MKLREAHRFMVATLAEHSVMEVGDVLLELLRRGELSREDFTRAVVSVRRRMDPEQAESNMRELQRLAETFGGTRDCAP